jgi:hypothetical protein
MATYRELEWDEVRIRHPRMSGLHVRDGRVISILCGAGIYKDSIVDKHVFYSVPQRPGYRTAIRALEFSKGRLRSFTVFQKIRKNAWYDLGRFVVKQSVYGDKDVRFELVPAPSKVNGTRGKLAK